MIDSKISLAIFSIMFIVLMSIGATKFKVDSINCSDPSNVIEEPTENISDVEVVGKNVFDIKNIIFGCSSSNQVINGLFLALKAGFILVLVKIITDVIPG